jgi:hypothetical protein
MSALMPAAKSAGRSDAPSSRGVEGAVAIQKQAQGLLLLDCFEAKAPRNDGKRPEKTER